MIYGSDGRPMYTPNGGLPHVPMMNSGGMPMAEIRPMNMFSFGRRNNILAEMEASRQRVNDDYLNYKNIELKKIIHNEANWGSPSPPPNYPTRTLEDQVREANEQGAIQARHNKEYQKAHTLSEPEYMPVSGRDIHGKNWQDYMNEAKIQASNDSDNRIFLSQKASEAARSFGPEANAPGQVYNILDDALVQRQKTSKSFIEMDPCEQMQIIKRNVELAKCEFEKANRNNSQEPSLNYFTLEKNDNNHAPELSYWEKTLKNGTTIGRVNGESEITGEKFHVHYCNDKFLLTDESVKGKPQNKEQWENRHPQRILFDNIMENIQIEPQIPVSPINSSNSFNLQSIPIVSQNNIQSENKKGLILKEYIV